VTPRTRRTEAVLVLCSYSESPRAVHLSTHLCTLREAGAAEVGTIWQFHDDRVLLTVR
jgi:hypothetical protein